MMQFEKTERSKELDGVVVVVAVRRVVKTEGVVGDAVVLVVVEEGLM